METLAMDTPNPPKAELKCHFDQMNRITERTSEQFEWRSSKLETTEDEQNYDR